MGKVMLQGLDNLHLRNSDDRPSSSFETKRKALGEMPVRVQREFSSFRQLSDRFQEFLMRVLIIYGCGQFDIICEIFHIMDKNNGKSQRLGLHRSVQKE